MREKLLILTLLTATAFGFAFLFAELGDIQPLTHQVICDIQGC